MTQHLNAARQYHSWDANVNAIQKGKKIPLHKWKHLHDQRQELAELEGYSWNAAGGVAIINGAGGWHTFDIDAHKDDRGRPTATVSDATIDNLLDALQLPRDYAWVWRGRSKAGWALALRCADPLPAGVLPAKKDEASVAWGWPEKDSGADWHHLELRYAHCQTIYPPSTGYQWRHSAPTAAPAAVPIHRIISAFFALCPPAPHTLGSIDRATIDQIKQNFDLVAYAEQAFGGGTQIDGDEVRVLGHGGMLINPAKGIWHCFGDDIGGDCFDLIAYDKYRTTARNLNGKSPKVLATAAKLAGVTLPDRKPAYTVDVANKPQPLDDDGRPAIDVTDLDIPTVVAQTWGAIIATNDPPALFQRGGQLVRLERSDADALVLTPIDTRRMAGILARAARWVRTSMSAKTGPSEREITPPSAIVDDCMVNIDQQIPLIARIVHAPTFAPNGEVLITPGYHAAARIYYDPRQGATVPAVPDEPTDADLERARSLILDNLLIDFPFVSDADRAHAVALFLLPFVRELISGPTPLHLVEAPTMGSGKGLLAECLLWPALGETPTPMAEAKDDDEWRKRLTSTLIGGPAAIYIDNLNHTLASGALAMALTARELTDRILGKSEQVRLPVRCVWVATANNATLSTEISRRCIRIRIDPQIDKPWQRKDFKHPKLRGWVESNAADLIWAALVLCRYGLAHGMAGQALGSYESWSDVLGRILQGTGIPGFLGNLDALYDRADAEGTAWRTLIAAWWEKHHADPLPASELFPLVAEVDADILISGKDDIGRKRSFGKALARVLDRVFTVDTAGISQRFQVADGGVRHKAKLWKLAPMEGGGLGCLGGFSATTPMRVYRDVNSSHMGDEYKKHPKPPIPPLPAYGIWRNADHDEPVTVVRVLGERDGVLYLGIQDSQTGIRADEVEFFEDVDQRKEIA